MKFLYIFLFLSLYSLGGQAKLFQNAYVSFELPANWSCSLEKTEWVCHDKHRAKKNRAVIILTAKEVGPSDTFKIYENHLRTPKFLANKTGKAQRSKVFTVKKWKIGGHVWVDSLHFGSEVQNFYTRYLATIKNQLGVLVTFSAHKQHYTKYTNDFMKAIRSLKIIAKRNLLSNKSLNHIRPSHETLGTPINAAVPQEILSDDLLEEEDSGMNSTKLYLLIAFLAAVGGIYIFIKKS